MESKSSTFRSSSDANVDQELVSGSPSDTIPRLLSALGYCFEHLIAENRVLVDTDVVRRKDPPTSAGSSSVLPACDQRCSLLDEAAEPKLLLEPGILTKNDIVNFDDVDELELENEANCQVMEEMLDAQWMENEANCQVMEEMLDAQWIDTEASSIDQISFSISKALSQHESKVLHLDPGLPTTESTIKFDYADALGVGSEAKDPYATIPFGMASSADSTKTGNGEQSGGLESARLRPKSHLSGKSRVSQQSGFRSVLSETSVMSSNVLPAWWWKRKQADSVDNASTLMMYLDGPEASTGYSCILKPAGKVRLTWDACWCILLLFEIWATPTSLVFVEHGALPLWWEVALLVSLFFFCADIVLSFFTGFVQDDVDIMDHRRIVLHYLKHWFLFDVLATIPWHWVAGNGQGRKFSSTTATRGLKAIRLIRLLRAAKLVRIMNSSKKLHHNMGLTTVVQRRDSDRRMKHNWAIGSILQAMCFAVLRGFTSRTSQFVFTVPCSIILLAHFHAIIWAALQDEWRATNDISLVFSRYFESFWWAFSSFTFGNTYVANKPELWLLDIAVLLERLMLCTWIARWVVGEAVMKGDDASKMKSREALKYMEEHDISLKTELQVVKYWNESGKRRKRQRWFTELVQASLPLELQQRINDELWSHKLRSLGLIEHLYSVSTDFVFQLSQLVNEDTYASMMLICKEGDPAKAAYHINSGELAVLSDGDPIAPFTAGMWIGEKALVNPDLRRYGSVIAKAMSTLMNVPAPAFFQLLTDMGIDEKFKGFCESELWKGFCGRCGLVGDHWAYDCPRIFRNHSSLVHREQTLFAGGVSKMLSTQAPIVRTISSDLSLFIGHYNLGHIEDQLDDIGIYNLDDLEEGFEYVQEELRSMEHLDLSPEQINILSAREVTNFRRKMSAQTSALMNARTSSAHHHYMFLSHYKVEAGTEAALMRSELESLIQEDDLHPAYEWTAPVYLDSEDLKDLQLLMDEVSLSHNLVLMLTKGVLTRPWCLLEIATAARDKVPVLPVNILKAGCEFTFPDDSFYTNLGTNIGSSGVDLIKQHGFEIEDVVKSLKQVFKRIAMPYSPHRPASIRKVELQELMRQTTVRDMKGQGQEKH